MKEFFIALKGRLLIVFIVNILIFVLLAVMLPIRFETSDDITMANIVNGVWYGSYDCHLLFQSCYHGLFLSLLYKLIPGIEWYSMSMVLVHIVSVTVVTYYLLDKIGSKVVKCCLLLMTYTLWAYIIYKFQFTSTTALLSFAACILLIDKRFVMGGVLFIWASLLRYESAFMIGLFMSPLFIYEYKFNVKKLYAPLLLILIFAFGLHIGNSFFYISDRSFIEHNIARSHIQDNPTAWRAVQKLPNGINELDYQMFTSFFYDSSVFSTDVMDEILINLDAIPLKHKVKDMFNTFIVPNIISLLFLTFFFLVSFFIIDNPKCKFFLSLSYVLWFMTFAILGTHFYIKPYVYFSSLFALLYNTVFLLSRGACSIKKTIGICVVCSYSFYVIFQLYSNRNNDCGRELDFYDQSKLIRSTDELVVGLKYDECILSPFNIQKSEPHNLSGYAFLTYESHSNTFRNILKEGILLLVDEESTIPQFVESSLERHDGIKVKSCVIARSGHFKLVKFIEVK